MSNRIAARIIFDQRGQVKEANECALEFTQGRARRGTAMHAALPLAMGGAVDALPGPFPVSCCRMCLTETSLEAYVFNYNRIYDDLTVQFEPLEFGFGFAEQLSDAIFVTDSIHSVVYANTAMRSLVPATVLTRCPTPTLRDTVAHLGVDPVAAHLMLRTAWSGGRLRKEFSNRDNTDDFGLVSAPLRYCGQICGAVWTLQGITPVGIADAALIKALSYRVAAMYQHELRNPLQTMKAAVAVLRTQAEGAACGLLDTVDRNILEISDILNEQMVPDRGLPTTRSRLSAIVDRAIEDARLRESTRMLSFEHVRTSAEPLIRSHHTALTRVFANLFRNTAQARPDARVRVSYFWDAQQLACVVEDDGPGFPPDVLTQSSSIQSAGTHLGLLLVASVIESSGGAVELRNAEWGGARVVLRLPRSDASRPAVHPAERYGQTTDVAGGLGGETAPVGQASGAAGASV